MVISEKKQVIFIIGEKYSGSTLSTMLLDLQPQIRGLGEARLCWNAGFLSSGCNICSDGLICPILEAQNQGKPFIA